MSLDSPIARAPLSSRLCDGVCIGGALWTLACHFTVVTSGNLYGLMVTATVLGIGGIAGWIILGRRTEKGSTASASASEESSDANRNVTSKLRIATAMAGVVIAAAYGLTGDIRQGWWLLAPWLMFALWQNWSAYDRPEAALASKTAEAALWFLALLTVAVTLVAHRPNIDDSYYLALATGAADHPQKPIYGFDPMFGTEFTAMRPPYYRVLSMELLAASVSWLTSLPAIFLMHFVFASCAALLVPLAAARLLRLLSPRYWLWCTVALMAFLLMDGDAPTSYGNMSLVRMQQGKSMMLMVALPLTVAYCLELMRRGTAKAWLLLAASVIFGLGCSPTAMILLPAVSGLTLLAAWRPTRVATVRLLAGVATSIYPVGVVLIVLALASQLPVVEDNWRESAGQATNYAYLMNYMYRQVFGASWLGVFVLWIIADGWAFFETAIARRVAIVLSLGCLLVFFNPWMSMVAAEHPSLIATYWRVLWIIPVPAMVAMFLTSGQSFLGSKATLAERTGVFAAALVVFFVALSGRSVLSDANGTEVKTPGLKVDERYAVAKRLCEIANEPEQIIAPEGVAGWVTTFHHHPFPLAARIRYLRAYGAYVTREEMLERYYLQGYVSGERRPEPSDLFFRNCLQEYSQLKAVCLANDIEWLPEAEEILRESGFEPADTPGPYTIWQRIDTQPESG